MEKIRQFIKNGKWKNLKKSDWVVLALIGILLLVIAFPMDGSSGKKSSGNLNLTQEKEDKKEETAFSQEPMKTGENWEDAYTDSMEKKLKKVLEQMEGVGKVEVMITVADKGERVVEKDTAGTATTTTETDSAGRNRTVTENQTSQETVFVDTGEETYPYVQKEKLPEIEGIVVVAEGGGNPSVVSDISDAIKALFPVEAHRIKVVKMCSKEE